MYIWVKFSLMCELNKFYASVCGLINNFFNKENSTLMLIF